MNDQHEDYAEALAKATLHVREQLSGQPTSNREIIEVARKVVKALPPYLPVDED